MIFRLQGESNKSSRQNSLKYETPPNNRVYGNEWTASGWEAILSPVCLLGLCNPIKSIYGFQLLATYSSFDTVKGTHGEIVLGIHLLEGISSNVCTRR